MRTNSAPTQDPDSFHAHAVRALDDVELLATLLARGRVRPADLDLARDLLTRAGDFAALHRASPLQLRYLGLSKPQATLLMAVAETTCRVARGTLARRPVLNSPDTLALYLNLRYFRCDQEIMGALFLDSRLRLLAEKEFFRGTQDHAAVEPRPMLRECLLLDATSLAIFHTHPSGDPLPSKEDHLFTHRMAAAAEAVGVTLIDHLVIGALGRWALVRPITPGAPPDDPIVRASDCGPRARR